MVFCLSPVDSRQRFVYPRIVVFPHTPEPRPEKAPVEPDPADDLPFPPRVSQRATPDISWIDEPVDVPALIRRMAARAPDDKRRAVLIARLQ